MKLMKNNYLKYSFVIMIVVIILIVSSIATQEVNNSITIATAIFGFLVILYQLSRDHKIKKAEFIYSLNNTFNENKDITYIYMKLKQGRNEEIDITDEDGRRMGDYVMFFMIMNHLVEEGLVSLNMIDAIFSNKFFLFCDNEQVYPYQTSEKEINKPLLELYEKWYNYRIKNKIEPIYEGYSLSDQEDLYKKEESGYIKLLG